MGVACADVPYVPPEPETAAWLGDIIKDLVVALITTVDGTGLLHTRQIPNSNRAFDGKLRFLSARATSLVDEVARFPDVLVTYADPGAQRYIVLDGVARVQHDPARVRELWHPNLASWFPAGPDDPGLALLEVDVTSIDLWE